MKNQYIANTSDYRKYGFLRALLGQNLSMLVAWMRTADDGSNDGNNRAYLDSPEEWREYDPGLFDALRRLTRQAEAPTVADVMTAGVLPGAEEHRDLLADEEDARARWFAALQVKVAALSVGVHDLTQKQGSPVAQLCRKAAKLMPGIGHRQGR